MSIILNMQTAINFQSKLFNLIPERIITRDPSLAKVFDLYETYFKHCDIYSVKEKYNIIKTILNNKMISESEKSKIFEIISENQKLYFAVCRIIYNYKYSKSKTYDNDYDLHGESLSEMPEPHKIVVFHENMKYIFKLTNLVSIINHSLSKCESFFVESEEIKNPYTNILFDKSILYNIYFAIKKTCINTPILFEMFFRCGFCIDKFKATYEPYILDEYIKGYINDLSKDKLHRLCYEILHKYKRVNRKMREFQFDRRYPKEKMIKNMKPIIQKYLFVKYSQNQGYRFDCERSIIRDLCELISKDKEFGKPLIKRSKRTGVQIIFKPLVHLNIFQFDPSSEKVIDALKEFRENDYKFVEDKFEFAPPVICEKVDEQFLRRMEVINQQRHRRETERERIFHEMNRRRTELDNFRNSMQSVSTDESGNRTYNAQSIYGLINEIMNDYVDQNNENVGALGPSNNVRRRLDFTAVAEADADAERINTITTGFGRATGTPIERHIDEDDLNETLANQVVPTETLSDSGSNNYDNHDNDEDDYDDDDDEETNDSMPELVDQHSDEEIFAIDYDTSANTQMVRLTQRPLYTPREESIIYTGNESNSDEETNVSLTTMGFHIDIRIPGNQENYISTPDTISDDYYSLRNIVRPWNYQIQDSLNQEHDEEEDEEEDDEESYDEGYDSF